MNKTLLTLCFLASFVLLGMGATSLPLPGFKNLQVLPKDITQPQLDSIMKSYTVALGVKCGFCHVRSKMIPDAFDYPADGEPMKTEARKMIRMNIQINKTYFHYDSLQRPEFITTVTCNSCHRGEAFPEH